ncbi:MAG: uncharacterized protein KVP18_003540 [Porospora cf. gigantea A]|nr:MAG: hypothetical protein KVP18_003540 [Porospora cf. gigantea A]
MKHTFERVLNSELLGLHLLMTEEDVARIVACEHAAEQEPHNRRLEREDCPPIWRRDLDRSRRDLDRTLHPPPPSPYYTDDDPIQEGPDSDTTMVPSHWLENTVYTQEYLIHDSLPNCFTPPGRETYQTACAVHTTPKLTPSPELTPSQLPITSSPFDLMADVLVEAITAALLFLPSKATRSEVKAIGVEHRQVGVIVRWPFK